MDEPGSRRHGRKHNAEGAQEAILDAAEEVFAEHGFDGARIDAIAAASGYNKSLIFQYFGDKLNLYAEVIRRADQKMRVNELQTYFYRNLNAPDLDAHKVKEIFTEGMQVYIDFLAANPNILRIYNWELAEGWQTFARIISEREYEEVEEFKKALGGVLKAGILRSNVDPIIQITLAVYICHLYLALIPIYQIFLPDQDFTSPEAMAHAKQFLMDSILKGMLIDPPEGQT